VASAAEVAAIAVAIKRAVEIGNPSPTIVFTRTARFPLGERAVSFAAPTPIGRRWICRAVPQHS
jgi:hypothetical protein